MRHPAPLAALAALAAIALPGPAPFAAEGKRPNFLFILVDDQAPSDFAFYDPESPLQAPNIGRLAAEGMVIERAYHMGGFVGAVCTPSRHMIMSGRTLWHLPIGPLAKTHCPPRLEKETLPAVFARAGYDTMRTCKRGNSYEAANKEFAVRHDASKRGGDAESGSAWHAERVLDYLAAREAAKDGDPFLIYFGFSHPHDTRDGTPELLAKYGATNHADKAAPPALHPLAPPLPRNWLPAHPFHHGHPGLRDEVAVGGVWERRDEATVRNEFGRELACAENIDIQVGRVLERLESMGELEDTYVVYTSDHGIAIGRHGLMGKQNLYEHSWRVPYVVKGPGIEPGSRAEGNLYLLDTLATLCELAGIEAPASNEGISFAPVLRGERKTVRETLYGVYNGGTKPGMRCVRKGDWKLVQYDAMDGAVRETQLFNLADNPDELLDEHHDPAVAALTGVAPKPHQRNLADDPRHAGKLAEMKALLLEEMRKHDDPWRLWDQPDDGLVPPQEGPRKAKKK